MKRKLSRREALKTLGLTIGGAAIGIQGFSQASDNKIEYSLGLDEVFKPR